MGYDVDESKVRGDVFTENGKWKYTVCLDYSNCLWNSPDIWTETRRALREATGQNISGVMFDEIPAGWILVVLEPYNKFSHPIIVKNDA